MEVYFANKKLQKKISDPRSCVKNYGSDMKNVIHRRLNQLHAAPNLETMRGIGDCHELKGKLRGYFAIDLLGPYRMIFRATGDPSSYTESNSIIWVKITSVDIVSIEDYH